MQIRIKTENKEKKVWALVDSGSYITCISEDFYKELVTQNRFKELPVTNTVVSVAIGKKAVVIKRQIWIEFQIEGYAGAHSFLVIPHLISQMILGDD